MILAVGSQEDLQRRFPNAITEDLNGQYLFPGFIDAHSHPAIFCREIRDPNFGNVRSWDIARSHIQEYIQAHPNRPWYVIFGWDEKKWGDLTQEALEKMSQAFPVCTAFQASWAKTSRLSGFRVSIFSSYPIKGAQRNGV